MTVATREAQLHRDRLRAAPLAWFALAGPKHAPGGLYERILPGLELLWIALAAGYIIAGPAGLKDG